MSFKHLVENVFLFPSICLFIYDGIKGTNFNIFFTYYDQVSSISQFSDINVFLIFPFSNKINEQIYVCSSIRSYYDILGQHLFKCPLYQFYL